MPKYPDDYDDALMAKWREQYTQLCGIDLRMPLALALPAEMRATLRAVRRDLRRRLRELERLCPTFRRPAPLFRGARVASLLTDDSAREQHARLCTLAVRLAIALDTALPEHERAEYRALHRQVHRALRGIARTYPHLVCSPFTGTDTNA